MMIKWLGIHALGYEPEFRSPVLDNSIADN